MSTAETIIEEVAKLTPPQQEQVLDYARSLASRPAGVKLSDLQSLVGSIPEQDLREMQKAIEEGCENVDADRW
jgi:hypothetical protein